MKVKVVHIITKLELGGAQQNTLYTVANLDRERFEPVLVAGEGGILEGEARKVPGLQSFFVRDLVREVSPLRDLLALAELTVILRGVVRGAGPGGKPRVIVHTHSSKAGVLGRLAARLAGVPVIVHTVHGHGFNDYQRPLARRFFVLAERLAARVTTAFAAVSRHDIETAARERIFDEGRVTLIRSGIDVGHFQEPPHDASRVRASIGVPADAPLAVMVSCLKPQKSPVDFVRVAARVLKSVPDAHFVQAGDGELRGAVEAEAGRLGVSGRFHLLGWRDDIRDIMHASDVVVLTSLWEGLPRVVLQAMAAGRPVVATAVAGTPEAVLDGVNGFLAVPRDVEMMGKKTALLLSDRALARRMGEAGRGMVAQFEQKKMLEDIETLYGRLLEGYG